MLIESLGWGAVAWVQHGGDKGPARIRADLVKLASTVTSIAPEADYVVEGMLKGGRPPSR